MKQASFILEVTTPRSRIISDEVDSVTLPGIEGQMQVLPGHASLVSIMDYGVVQYEKKGQRKKIAVHKGFFTINSDKVIVLADRGEFSDEIDIERAKKAAESARFKLEELQKEEEAEHKVKFYEAKLYRAITRINSQSN